MKYKWILYLAGAATLLFLGMFNQPYYPATWIDEGFVLQGPINLVEHGEYAMRSAEGFRVLDQPLIANGPGIVLPLAVTFKLFGIGLLQARMLIFVYFIATAVLFFRIVARLFDDLTAWFSMLVLIAVPFDGFIVYGRQSLGNMPGLFYFLAGFWFLLNLVEKPKALHALAAGLFFGLALWTKGQYWVLFPALGITALADIFFFRRLGWKNHALLIGTVLGCFTVWQGAQYLIVGAENYGAHIQAIGSSSQISVFAFRLERLPVSAAYLVRSGFVFMILPGVLLALWDGRQRDGKAIPQFFLAALVIFWTGWYLIASIGWDRYMFEAYSIGAIFSGWIFLRAYRLELVKVRWKSILKPAVRIFLVVCVLFAGRTLVRQVGHIVFEGDPSAHQFASYLRDNIPADAVIESWEWEMDVLTPDLTYHHPVNAWVDWKTAEIHFDDPIPVEYDPLEFHPAYLVDGPFSKFTGLYGDALAQGCCSPIIDFGEYDLYKVNVP